MTAELRIVDVELGKRSYPVVIGPGALDKLSSVLPPGTKRVAVVTQADISVMVEPGVECRTFLVSGSEEVKNLSTIEHLCSQWAQWGLTRSDAVVGVGGGLVTDLAGFAASVYHRGLPVIYVSTTLLGQIDASVGGKTGVNLLEGKNLVGTFWQPSAVLCDTEVLKTLPEREWRCGYGEMAKYELLGLSGLRLLDLTEQIARCVELKADVVARDERESGYRSILNYGHTLAHALEISEGFALRHGEAVSIGLLYAAELAKRLGRINEARVEEHREVIAHHDLVDRLPSGVDAGSLVKLFSHDKKALDGTTFVLDGPNGVQATVVKDEALLLSALDAVR